MKAEILAWLRESDKFVSGQELCNRFGVSRTAVWKVINQLKKEGYRIEAVQNKGYHMVSSPDLLSKYELESRINTQWLGRKIVYKEVVGSTNAEVRKMAEDGAGDDLLVVADGQTLGKGRRGRTWESPKGTNLYFSVLLKPNIAPDKASMITLVAAYSVAKVIREKTGLDAKIKWPNDIVVGKKKVCGILTEMSMERDYIHYVVVGIGINVNEENFPAELEEMATSLKKEKGSLISRANLLCDILLQFEEDYIKFLAIEDLGPFLDEYNKILVNKGALVKVLDPKGEFSGIAGGIGADGRLIVFKENGQIETVYAGEVSVRGMYGYV
ncbi:MAG: biotin--[Lachnospiraceae bacterium]|nr:biotin--[acetyl-CoA-carboxylase] ligase [Lachnospiraceae bacterium]